VKRGISIVMALLMLAAMFHITVATHFCGGEVAASLISFSGKLASCGMEGPGKELPLPGTYFTRHCCEDVVTAYGTDSNYSPSVFVVNDISQDKFQIFNIPTGTPVNSIPVLKSISNNGSPPGVVLSTYVDLSYICVFRI
jgi:hypothetical protein